MKTTKPRKSGLLSCVLNTSRLPFVFLIAALAVFSSNVQAQWTPVPLNATDIISLAIDPANQANMFAGIGCQNQTTPGNCSSTSGLYKSTNSGSTWVQDTNFNIRGKAVTAIAIAPDNSINRKMFVAVDKQGVFKSIDGGQSWTQAFIRPATNPTANYAEHITQIIITNKIGNQQAIYALVRSDPSGYTGAAGIYATVDDGNTWNKMYTGSDILKMAVAKNQANTLYVSTTPTGELRKASNVNPASSFSSINFASITSGLPLNGVVTDFIIDPSNSNYLYATAFNNSVEGFYRSINAGASWTSLSTNSFSKLAVDTAQAPTKYYGSKNDSQTNQAQYHIYSSTNGTTWTIDDSTHPGFPDSPKVLDVANGVVYAGVSTGLFKNGTGDVVASGLDIRLTVRPTATVREGGDITYSMTLQNLSTNVDATNFTVTSTTALPLGTTFVSATPTTNSCTVSQTRMVSCNVASINRNSLANLGVTVRLPNPFTQNQVSMTFRANVSGDTNLANNTNITALTTVSQTGNLTVPVANNSPTPRTVRVGDTASPPFALSATPVSATDQLTYIIESGGNGTLGTFQFVNPSNALGTESLSPNFTYTPNSTGATGTDTIRFRVRDNQNRTSTTSGTFTINVTAPASNPTVSPQTTGSSGGAVHPIIFFLLGLMLLGRRFK